MKEEIEFLEYIYQNAKMGQDSIINMLKTRNKNDEIELVLKEQLKDYRKVVNSASAMLERRMKKAKDINVMAKIGTYMNIKLNMLGDDSPQKVADMFIEGSKMGIEQIEKNLQEYNISNKYVKNLGEKLLEIEKKNISNLHKYSK